MYLIGEIGINHDGRLSKAIELMQMAKICRFDAVKFQKRDYENLYTEEKLAEKKDGYGTYKNYKKELEFGLPEYIAIAKEAERLDIDWFASVWDCASIDFFEENYNCFAKKPKYIKIPSPMNFDDKLLKRAGNSFLYLIISTGFCDFARVKEIVKMINGANETRENISCLMQCTSAYPCKDKDININSLVFLQNKIFNIPIGFSNHSPGILASIGAMFHDAAMVEVHITLDRSTAGSDHASSIEPVGMAKLAKYRNIIPLMMGKYEKNICDCEKKELDRLRRGLKSWEQGDVVSH